MTVVIIVIVATWMVFSAFLVTTACMNSSRISRMEVPARQRSALVTKSRPARLATQINQKTAPIRAEI